MSTWSSIASAGEARNPYVRAAARVALNMSDRHDTELKLEHETLLAAVRTITSTLVLDTVLERLLELTNQILGFEYCTILLIGDDGVALEVAARYGYPQSIVQKIDLAVGKGLTGRVAQTGEPIIVPDVASEERYLAGLKGARSELVVPIMFENRVIGVYDVQNPRPNAFSQRDMEFLQTLADVASVAIVNAKNHEEVVRIHDEAARRARLEREMNRGRVIQERLLPRSDPELRDYEVAGMNLPSETISGDYFDYIELPNENLGIAVADVSGKGVAAALLAASLQAMLRANVENLYSIATIVERVNRTLYRSTSRENFATLFYGVFDPAGCVTYVNAGHNPPLIIRASGEAQALRDGGTVLGFLEDAEYSQGRGELEPDDYLIMYTDGLTDVTRDGEPFGEARIVETAGTVLGASSRVMASVLITEAASFTDPGHRPPDDMTVVVVRRRPL
jgi:serine phosphatase RsbU (regulator of sigma subunit)